MGMTLVGILATILISLFVRLLGVEIGVRHLPVCRWLVKVAAARLPAEERAAIESEWLAVIEDLRSPTAQLLHSLSYVVSAFRIRRAIAPETRLESFKRSLLIGQLTALGASFGVAAALLNKYEATLTPFIRSHIANSRPVAFAVLVALILATAMAFYLSHRLSIWAFHLREKRRQARLTAADRDFIGD
ncbi:hypothetical protein [Bradyrhizobium sp. CCGUVB23]|uniref:hypothetical protein n=1 Tax=Bradyrhizobium sp. CCGUVB23 TaxID=2949630 RepID=UPI0020B4517D|nr:hypothetical protein [Bradyrhizobium sp. CCGUVB23]MCP3462531.1 hypothetical protein [Bradyrhizobium sp. CCGUVB23]